MIRSLQAALTILAVVAIPGAALADFTATSWPSPYKPIPWEGAEHAVSLPLTSTNDDAVVEGWELPFPFLFAGESYTAINIGMKGYISFDPGVLPNSRDPAAFLADGGPEKLVAVWWGDHYCNQGTGDLAAQTLGETPRRAHVIQWRCTKRGSAGQGSDSFFEAQLWLHEEGALRVRYGNIRLGSGNDWTNVAWGVKAGAGAGVMGPTRGGAPASCSPRCGAADYPKDTAIQYGLTSVASVAVGLVEASFAQAGELLEVEVDAALRNHGGEEAELDYELYLSPTDVLVPGGLGTTLLEAGRTTLPVAEGSPAVSRLDGRFQADPAPGCYFVCVVVDRAGARGIPGAEWACSPNSFSWGPDLLAKLSGIPSMARAGGEATFVASIENLGTHAAGEFRYRFIGEPDDLPAGADPAGTAVLYTGVIGGLGAGETFAVAHDGVALPKIKLPPTLRGDRYRVFFTVDDDLEVPDTDRTNNKAYSAGKISMEKPDLSLDRDSLHVEFPYDECIFGEPVQATLRLCNQGSAPASNFQPGIILSSGDSLAFFQDAAAATFPQLCHSPFSPNSLSCDPVGGQPTVCASEICRLSCESDGECPSSLRCIEDRFMVAATGDPGAKSCQPSLASVGGSGGNLCQTFEVQGVVPKYDRNGAKLQTGEHSIFFVDDVRRSLNQTKPDVFTKGTTRCAEALPNLQTVELSAPETVVAGEAFPAVRLIRNLGYVEQLDGEPASEFTRFTYRYYLAPPGGTISTSQIPLAVQATGDKGFGLLRRKSDDLRTDLVEIPDRIPPGRYQLGMILDPENELREMAKNNNVYVLPELIEIQENRFAIISGGLPSATVGGLYTFQFAAAGGTASYRWSGSRLPLGLELDSSGLLRGIPREAGDFAFNVRVRSGDRAVERTVALRVLAPRGTLDITTRTLPAAVRNQPYGGFVQEDGRSRDGIPLAAAGGIPPYRWELVLDDARLRLPQGLVFEEPAGIVSGQPSLLSETQSFEVKVIDSAGIETSRILEIAVVGDKDLMIASRAFADGLTSLPYESCIEAAGGVVEEGGYRWTVDPGSPPAGLEADRRGKQLCLLGTPRSCGNFMVEVEVEDDLGKSFATSLPLTIECEPIRVNNRFTRAFHRGETIETKLGSNAGEGAIYMIFMGALPAGLELDEEGRLFGTIADDAGFGRYDFIVEVRDGAGRQGLTALTLTVASIAREQPTTKRTTGGCSASSGAGAGLGSMGLFGAILFASRCSRHRSRRRERGLLSSTLGRLAKFGALATIGGVFLLGCGETEEIIKEPPCSGVVCDGGLSCDPADGLCKCGGADGSFCREGQYCVTDPSPRCAPLSCEFVSCERGHSCDPQTGTCSCGGSVCEEGEHCIDRRCVTEGLCEDVRCTKGFACDPDDGSCKCDGSICDSHQSCIEGRCADDLCAGVSCTTGTQCNPIDGSCHCGGQEGPICSPVEACIVDAAAELLGDAPAEEVQAPLCIATDHCLGNSCGGGSTCDPKDGACRCGGVGSLFPVCGPGQICLDGECKGGALCERDGEPIECAAGNSCDPFDGLCKCGGAGGAICLGSDACVRDERGEAVCAAGCTIELGAANPCGVGEACYLDRHLGHGRSFCAEAGPQGVNEPCSAFNDCRPGFYCSQAEICRRLCRPSEGDRVGCGDTEGARCLPFAPNESEQEDLGYCISDFG